MCSYLVFFILVVLVIDIIALTSQTLNPENNYIKKIVLEDRSNCKIEQSDQILHNAHHFDNCADRTLPSVGNDLFIDKEYILCVGYYQVLYALCEYDSSPMPFPIDDTKNFSKICDFSNSVFNTLNVTHTNSKVKDWFQYVKDSMSNKTVCLGICVFIGKVDPKCTVLVNLLHYYNEVSSKIGSAKKSSVTSNVKELAGVVQNVNKDSSIAVTHLDVPNEKLASPVDQPIISLNPNVVKAEGGVKLSNTEANTNVPAPNIVSPEAHKDNKESEQEKSFVKADENVIHTDITNKPSQPQMDLQAEDIKENEPPLDGFEKEVEGIPPSSDKESLVGNSFDDSKVMDNKVDGGIDESKLGLGSQLNTNDQDGEILSGGEYMHDNFKEAEDSNFFAYFLVMTGGCIVAYVLFHNRNKLVALALEGRKGRSARARGGGRHSSASYSKLHSNLEEAIASNTTAPSATNVLY